MASVTGAVTSTAENVKPKTSRAKKIAKGCSLGCLGALVVPAVAFGLFGNQIKQRVFGDPDTNYLQNLAKSSVSGSESTMQVGTTPKRVELADGGVIATLKKDPTFQGYALDPNAIPIKIKGKDFTVYAVTGHAPTYRTKEQDTEFYIGDIASARTNGLQAGFNVSTNLNVTTKLEFKDTFIMPSPNSRIDELVSSGFFEKHNLEFVGVVGTSYVHEAMGGRGTERRAGLVAIDGKIVVDTLDKDHEKLSKGYYTTKEGKVVSFELNPDLGLARTQLNTFIQNPGVLAVTVCGHSEQGAREVSFSGKPYRTAFLSFGNNRLFQGAVFTTEARGDADRQKQVIESFPGSSMRIQLDGDFYAKPYILGAGDAYLENPIALTFEFPHLVVRHKRPPGQYFDQSLKILTDYNLGASIVTSAQEADYIKDSRDPDKIAQKLGDRVPGFLQFAFGSNSWAMHQFSSWASNDPYVRGFMIREKLKKIKGPDTSMEHTKEQK